MRPSLSQQELPSPSSISNTSINNKRLRSPSTAHRFSRGRARLQRVEQQYPTSLRVQAAFTQPTSQQLCHAKMSNTPPDKRRTPPPSSAPGGQSSTTPNPLRDNDPVLGQWSGEYMSGGLTASCGPPNLGPPQLGLVYDDQGDLDAAYELEHVEDVGSAQTQGQGVNPAGLLSNQEMENTAFEMSSLLDAEGMGGIEGMGSIAGMDGPGPPAHGTAEFPIYYPGFTQPNNLGSIDAMLSGQVKTRPGPVAMVRDNTSGRQSDGIWKQQSPSKKSKKSKKSKNPSRHVRFKLGPVPENDIPSNKQQGSSYPPQSAGYNAKPLQDTEVGNTLMMAMVAAQAGLGSADLAGHTQPAGGDIQFIQWTPAAEMFQGTDTRYATTEPHKKANIAPGPAMSTPNLEPCRIIRDPRLSDSVQLRNPDDSDFTHIGLVRPGLIDLGHLLRVGTFDGIRGEFPERFPFGITRAPPSSGADILVTILHRFNPDCLQEFFENDHFDFSHEHRDGPDPEAPRTRWRNFVIQRRNEVIRVRTQDLHLPAPLLLMHQETILPRRMLIWCRPALQESSSIALK